MPIIARYRNSPWSKRSGCALALAVLALVAIAGQQAVQSEPAAPRSSLTSVLAEAKKQPATPAGLQQSCTKFRGKFAHAVAQFDVDASRDRVWGALTDYSEYPRIFHRIKTCKITKRVGDRLWIESELQPHFFVRRSYNRTFNDLSAKPERLDWQLLEGNFTEVRGSWELMPVADGSRCHVTYMLEVDPGPVIPAFLVSFALKFVQREVISELTAYLKSRPQHPSSQEGNASTAATTAPAS